MADKRAAMAAHVSQTMSSEGARTLAVFLRLPRPVFGKVFRYEWFRELGRPPQTPLLDDIFATLNETARAETPQRSPH